MQTARASTKRRRGRTDVQQSDADLTSRGGIGHAVADLTSRQGEPQRAVGGQLGALLGPGRLRGRPGDNQQGACAAIGQADGDRGAIREAAGRARRPLVRVAKLVGDLGYTGIERDERITAFKAVGLVAAVPARIVGT